MLRRLAIAAFMLGLLATSRSVQGRNHHAYPAMVQSPDGVVDYTGGTLYVPESRLRSTGREIAVPYYHFRAARPSGAPPIFLLAGGPGDSWIDRFASERGRSEVLFLRQFADVILFDQRGAGHSRPKMECPGEVRLPLDQAASAADRIAAMRKLAAQCRDYWTNRGIDLKAYSTIENADDLDQLRKTLGYQKINIVAGSYGSHLALSYMRRHGRFVERAMLRGLEGPDHTWDSPSGVLAALGRIAASAEKQESLKPHVPPGGLVATLRSVVQRLDAQPVTAKVGETPIVLGGEDIRRAAKFGARRDGRWPAFVIDLARGDYSTLAQQALPERTVRLGNPMYYMMDCASGISPARDRLVQADPAAALLGDINVDYTALCDIWDAPDLGAGFRSDVVTDIPVLMFQGTWDVNTPLENAREVARGLRNLIYSEVEGGTHPTFDDLYAGWAPMQKVVQAFLTGARPQVPPLIALPPVTFALPQGKEAVK